MFKHIQMLIFLIFFLGCASGTILIDTLPQGSDVEIKSNMSSEFILIGKSPLKITTNEIKDKYKLSGPIAFRMSHEGYLKEYTYLTEMPINTDINMTLMLKTEKNPEQTLALNKLMDQIFDCQRLIKVGNYQDALANLEKIRLDNPQLSVIHEMKGGVYYIQKDYAKALDSYELALKYNNENLELLSMKKFLQKKLNGENKP